MKGLGNYVAGHVKIYVSGSKYYHARLSVDDRMRWSRARLRTASAAEHYGEWLIARYEALKKVAV
jgi:hypothetical protein